MAQYDNLKDYFYGEYSDEIKSAISSHIVATENFHGNISNITILSLECADDAASNVRIKLGISANVVNETASSTFDNDFFIVIMKGNLDIQFQDICIMEIKRTEYDELPKDNILSHFILPDIPIEQVERIGNELYAFYKEHAKFTEPGLSLEKIIDNMYAPIFFSELSDDCLGRVNFINSDEKIYHYDTKEKKLKYDNHCAEPGTILINKKRYHDELNGEMLITVAHELVHWQLHQKFFKLLVILGTNSDTMNCNAMLIVPEDNMSDVQKALCIAEWQANALAMRLAIPQSTVKSTINKIANDPSTYLKNDGDRMQKCVIEFAKIYNVSCFVAKERLRQLGYDFVDGTILEYKANGKMIHLYPFYFQPGTLKENETFVIYREHYEQLLQEDDYFAELIASGRYVYLGYVVCMLSAKYVKVKFNKDEIELMLTDYARAHADECLIKFKYRSITSVGYHYPYHITAYLYKNTEEMPEYNKVIPESFELCNEDTEVDGKLFNMIEEFNDGLNALKSKKCATLANTVIYHMRKKEIGCKELAKRTTLSTTAIVKIYTEKTKKVNIRNVLTLCLALELTSDECYDLFEKAKHNLREDTLQNRAYRFIIENQYFNLEECNKILRYFRQEELPYRQGN